MGSVLPEEEEAVGKMSKHDRAKSGGLLDTLFGGRPHKKGGSRHGSGHYGTGGGSLGGGGVGGHSGYGSGSLNGGRPLSGAEAEAAHFEELQAQMNRMAEPEVNQKFQEILEDMNIPKDKREPLLLKTLEEKKQMILMHLKGEFGAAGAADFECLFLFWLWRGLAGGRFQQVVERRSATQQGRMNERFVWPKLLAGRP